MKKITRIFTCKNGHNYKSKKPINTGFVNSMFPLLKLEKANDHCKKCGAVIISEEDYVNGKVVMGAVRIK